MNEATLQKMKNMKFYGMMRAFSTTLESGQTSRYTPDEMVGFLVESEWDERHNRKIDRGLKNAKFRYKANIEDLIFDQKRNLDKNEVHRLADCTFIGKKQNIIITTIIIMFYALNMISLPTIKCMQQKIALILKNTIFWQ